MKSALTAIVMVLYELFCYIIILWMIFGPPETTKQRGE
ncbi:MAG: hypothetical protein RIQ54_555 [Candidatus Parcubacteria bacterium]